MTLYEKLIAAGLPIASATEQGQISGLPGAVFTDEQIQTMNDVILEHLKPVEYAELIAYRADVQALRDDYLWAIGRLGQIQAAVNPTNAQVIQAIKDLAKIQERLLKFLKSQIL